MNTAPPKGTRDFYPEDWARQAYLFDHWRKVCLQWGFVEYEGPTFEHLELYTQKSGEEIAGQLYCFTDKGQREIALRPELTPTLARMVAQKGPALKFPLKWFSIPRLYRYERMQKGRLREFYQLNLDILGCPAPFAEWELLSAVVALLTDLKLSDQDFVIGVSSRKLLASVLALLHISPEKTAGVYAALDKRLKLSPPDFRRLLEQTGLDSLSIDKLEDFFKAKNLEDLKSYSSDIEYQNAYTELNQLFTLIQETELSPYIQLDLSVVRGLAYYTGIVFEVFDRAKSMRAIAGGGRYDKLLEQMGGKPLSGVGFGVGDVVLWDLLEQKGIQSPSPYQLDFWVVQFTPNSAELLSLVWQLRQAGYKVGYTLENAKFKKQMQDADAAGAAALVFLGSDQTGPGEVEIKFTQTREQIKILLTDLLDGKITFPIQAG